MTHVAGPSDRKIVQTEPNLARQTRPRHWLRWVSLALAFTAFAIDVRWGLAPIAQLLYLFPPLLAFWSASKRQPLLVGAKVTALSVTAMVLRGDFAVALLANRALDLAAVWITVVLCVIHHRDRLALLAEKAIGRSYLDIADELITVLQPDESVVLMNPKGCEMMGVEPAEILGSNGVDRLFPEQARDEVRRGLRELATGAASSRRFESKLTGKGGQVRIIGWHWAVPQDAQGSAMCLIGSGTDLTERRQAEASLLGEAALTRLGEMALMVAHEVKNPLAGIRGAVQVMGDRFTDDPKLQRFAERALLSIDGLTKLVDDLLVFARPGLPTRSALRVLPLVRDVAALIEKDPRVGGGHVTVRGEDPEINGDASLLRQAVLNLLVNAAEAGGPGKEIDVLVRCVGAGGCIEVHDSGPGIPTEMRTKVFEPFYSTKPRGSGLGLAIAKRVVTLHGGDIEVKCPAQGGTTMIVSLP